MRIETISVFPQLFSGSASAVDSSIIGRARSAGLLELINHDLRDFTHDRHRTTDDEPYGGGQGLLMKVEPVFEALDFLEASERREVSSPELSAPSSTAPARTPTAPAAAAPSSTAPARTPTTPAQVIFFAPFGERFDQAMARELAELPHLIMVCGHYEGFDERVYQRADRIISLGDFILTGGELVAMCVIDAICRLLPGVLGDERSAVDDSFTDMLLEYPQYTRPAEYRGMSVPEILLSGNHAAIRQWRREQSIIRTAELRPDLLLHADLDDEEREWLSEHMKREK
ncbi:MAG: tRNA (guanosine(37)-N1)-methyltransferase TrmD [Coriobacteriia bacterium]|nr:tRNA (guanosine(37)-N1)-methyltransferase TrmD [Coriobacteriia bacterium]